MNHDRRPYRSMGLLSELSRSSSLRRSVQSGSKLEKMLKFGPMKGVGHSDGPRMRAPFALSFPCRDSQHPPRFEQRSTGSFLFGSHILFLGRVLRVSIGCGNPSVAVWPMDRREGPVDRELTSSFLPSFFVPFFLPGPRQPTRQAQTGPLSRCFLSGLPRFAAFRVSPAGCVCCGPLLGRVLSMGRG